MPPNPVLKPNQVIILLFFNFSSNLEFASFTRLNCYGTIAAFQNGPFSSPFQMLSSSTFSSTISTKKPTKRAKTRKTRNNDDSKKNKPSTTAMVSSTAITSQFQIEWRKRAWSMQTATFPTPMAKRFNKMSAVFPYFSLIFLYFSEETPDKNRYVLIRDINVYIDNF